MKAKVETRHKIAAYTAVEGYPPQGRSSAMAWLRGDFDMPLTDRVAQAIADAEERGAPSDLITCSVCRDEGCPLCPQLIRR